MFEGFSQKSLKVGDGIDSFLTIDFANAKIENLISHPKILECVSDISMILNEFRSRFSLITVVGETLTVFSMPQI